MDSFYRSTLCICRAQTRNSKCSPPNWAMGPWQSKHRNRKFQVPSSLCSTCCFSNVLGALKFTLTSQVTWKKRKTLRTMRLPFLSTSVAVEIGLCGLGWMKFGWGGTWDHPGNHDDHKMIIRWLRWYSLLINYPYLDPYPVRWFMMIYQFYFSDEYILLCRWYETIIFKASRAALQSVPASGDAPAKAAGPFQRKNCFLDRWSCRRRSFNGKIIGKSSFLMGKPTINGNFQ